MTRARLAGIWLLLGGGCWTACRQVSLCEGEADCTPPVSMAGEGGALAPARPAGGGAPASVDAPAAVGGLGSSDGGGGETNVSAAGASGAAAETPGGQPAVGPTCAAGHADCDESSLTVCETPTNYSFRHCGACNARCDGTCSIGKCKPAEKLLDKGMRSFAANALGAFALVPAPNDTENLLSFDLDTGDSRVLTEGLEWGAKLLLGADRLYAYYPSQVISVGRDGMGAITEAFSPESFGVTGAGVYYTSYVTNPATDVDTWTLWFKPSAASTFTALSSGREHDILGSSNQALLVSRETDGNPEILLARGADLTSLGDGPDDPLAALPAGDGAAFLLSAAAVPSGYELVWLLPDEPATHVPLEAPPADHELVPAPGGVALQLDDRHNTFVRLFSPLGAEAGPLGITNTSTLAYVDERYLWYSWYGASDASQQFLRARQFELKDLIPAD